MQDSSQIDDTDQTVAADRLPGAAAIGVEIGEPPHRVYYLFARGLLPGVYKSGKQLVGSKEALRRNHRNSARSGRHP